MSVAALLARAKAAGVTILVHDGGMKLIGKPEAIHPLVDDLRDQKVAILALLESEKSAANDDKAPIDQTAAAPADPAATGPDTYTWPNGTAMNGSELALMATRLAYFVRLGLDINQAERQADRLKERDRERDDRHACLECASLSGHPSAWRCRAFRQRGARDMGLPADLAVMLQRCPTFQSASMAGHH